MIRTYGLSHVSLTVRDAERAFAFYHAVFGLEAVQRSEGVIQAQTPGKQDVIVFDQTRPLPEARGGIDHFGFQLVDPKDIDAVVEAVVAAGGTVLRRGEHEPGFPYAYVLDPDGHEIEIWYE